MINLPSKRLDLDFIKSGELTKMKIHACSDADYKKDLPGSPITVLINPDSYSREYKLKVSDVRAQGAPKALLKYEYSEPAEISFEFLFDNTGIIDGKPNKKGISEDIQAFKDVLTSYQGEFHQPAFIKLAWGTQDGLFKGRLMSLNIQYKLFGPDGSPLRAIAKATFKESISDLEQAAEKKNNSPDLTHVVLVKAGDTLPLLCNRIYENPKYYLQVAKINRLGNFRQLEPGMELVFPPVDKISSKLA